jgi:hypothetical protein
MDAFVEWSNDGKTLPFLAPFDFVSFYLVPFSLSPSLKYFEQQLSILQYSN